MVKDIDIVIGQKDYAAMPNLMLLQLAGDGDRDAWRAYLRRTETSKSDTVTPQFSIEEIED